MDLYFSDDSEGRFLDALKAGAPIDQKQVRDVLLCNSFNLNPAMSPIIDAEMAHDMTDRTATSGALSEDTKRGLESIGDRLKLSEKLHGELSEAKGRLTDEEAKGKQTDPDIVKYRKSIVKRRKAQLDEVTKAMDENTQGYTMRELESIEDRLKLSEKLLEELLTATEGLVNSEAKGKQADADIVKYRKAIIRYRKAQLDEVTKVDEDAKEDL